MGRPLRRQILTSLPYAYSALFYSLPVINTILMPLIMAVLASRLWDMEIKGCTPKLLYTLQSRRSLFAGKAVFGVLEVLLVTVLELACVPALGVFMVIPKPFPLGSYLSVRLHAGCGRNALLWGISADAVGGQTPACASAWGS